METQQKERKSKRQRMAESGVIAEQYQLTDGSWFVRIYPCLNIGKYKFSFAQKGSNGKGFDVYMDIEDLELWVDDILDASKTLLKTIIAEKKANEKYPKTYKYVTGENGMNSLGIGVATVNNNGFAVINGSGLVTETNENGESTTKKRYANVPVDYNWLRKFAKEFRRETSSYFRKMTELTLKTAASYKPNVDDDFSSNQPANENNENEPSSSEAKTMNPSNHSSATPKQDSSAQTQPQKESKSAPVDTKPFCEYLKSTTKLMPLNNNPDILVIKGINKEKVERIIYFMPQECSAAGNEFDNFKKMAEQRTNVGFHILISPDPKGKLRFTKFKV